MKSELFKMPRLFGSTVLLAGAALLASCGSGGDAPTAVTLVASIATNSAGAITADVALPSPGTGNSIVASKGTVFKDATGAPVVGALTVSVTYASAQSELPAAVLATVPNSQEVAAFFDISILSASGQKVKSFTDASGAPLPISLKMTVPGSAIGSKVDIYLVNNDGTGLELLQAGAIVDANGQVSFTVPHLTNVRAQRPRKSGVLP